MSLPCRRLHLTRSVAASMLLAFVPPALALEPPALPELCAAHRGEACVRAVLDRARREAESIGDPAVPGEAGIVGQIRAALAKARTAAKRIENAELRSQQLAFLPNVEAGAAGLVTYTRMWTLALVARATAEAGFPAEGNAMVPAILREWSRHAMTAPDGADYLVVHVARAQVRFGFADDALATVGHMADPEHRDEALVAIAAALAAAGRDDEARASVGRVANPEKAAKALRGIAEAQARAQRFDTARETIADIAVVEDRAWARNTLARALLDAGLLDEALETASGIEDDGARRSALSHVAGAHADAGRFEAALAIAGQVPGMHEAFSRIASAQARHGRFEAALSTAERIGWVSWRASAMREIAARQAAAGLVEEARATFAAARETAATIVSESNPSERSEALAAIAVAQAEAGLFEDAPATAGVVWLEGGRLPVLVVGAVASTEARVEALAAIAVEQAKARHVEYRRSLRRTHARDS